jgi:hypothetical protein
MARHGCESDGMCMITAYFARVYQRDTGHLWRDFLFLLQEVRPIGKTRNQLYGYTPVRKG